MIVKDKNKQKNGKFFQANNEVVEGSEISNGAKGLLCFMLSRHDNFEIHLSYLINECKDGRRAIESQMNELIAAKYVKKIQGTNKRKDTRYIIYEVPYE